MIAKTISQTPCFVLTLAFVSSCSAATTQPTERSIVIDPSDGYFAGIPLSLTISELDEMHFEVERRQIVFEGDSYNAAEIGIAPDIVVTAMFDITAIPDEESTLYSLETMSEAVRDVHGMGVGSTLSQLSNSWPQGEIVYGEAHGLFARFLTGTQIVYSFDPLDLDADCFDQRMPCDSANELTVEKVTVYAVPVPVP